MSMVGNLMTKLTTKKFDWSQPIHDHVTSMTNLAAKMKGMGMEVNYNTIKEKWNFQEVKAMLVQEEGRLKKMKNDSIYLFIQEPSSTSRFRPSNTNKGKGKEKIPIKYGKIHKEMKCFFCKKNEHYKKNCPKRKKWFEKKGKHFVSIIDGLFLTEVPNNTWWLDSGATTHVSHIVQGFISIQTHKTEKFFYMGNRVKAQVHGIGIYRLILDSGNYLDLEKCL
ncbi:hypothetical protein Lal_00032627 [Lupinus albus]|nr:hypothetical protein Lal_00032627 [Lupinus albus]